MKDVVRQWSDIIPIARNAEEFVAAAEKALAGEGHERVQKGLALARNCSWESTVGQMQDIIKSAIGKNDRPSKKPIEPLTVAELSYQYQHTPGS